MTAQAYVVKPKMMEIGNRILNPHYVATYFLNNLVYIFLQWVFTFSLNLNMFHMT